MDVEAAEVTRDVQEMKPPQAQATGQPQLTPWEERGLFTWAGGTNTHNDAGVYGTQGVPATTNIPRARWGAVTWTDKDGNHWLFGGANDAWDHDGRFSSLPTAHLNDLWRYNPGIQGVDLDQRLEHDQRRRRVWNQGDSCRWQYTGRAFSFGLLGRR
jgi:hypothetical protein